MFFYSEKIAYVLLKIESFMGKSTTNQKLWHFKAGNDMFKVSDRNDVKLYSNYIDSVQK